MMNIKQTFLNLTSTTVPFGNETILEKYLPKEILKDSFGNYFMSIGDNYTVMFTSHLDTACKDYSIINHVIDDNLIKTDNKTILGADDKAGVTLMLYMIEKQIPGLYYFFLGEEVGCKGSNFLSKTFLNDYPHINKIISFDRKGTKSVISHQMYGRCCSDDFASSLCSELNKSGLEMVIDKGGVLTDSAQFMDIVPECTNISVGYMYEHTKNEQQDIFFLEKLCRAVTQVNWESLTVSRDPSIVEYDDYDDMEFFYMYGYLPSNRLSNYEKSGYTNNDNSKKMYVPGRVETIEEYMSHTKPIEFSSENTCKLIDINGEKFNGYISYTWIQHEINKICSILKKMGRDEKSENILWDGRYCWSDVNMDYIGSRSDLVTFLPSLDEIPASEVKKDLKGDVGKEFEYYSCVI